MKKGTNEQIKSIYVNEIQGKVLLLHGKELQESSKVYMVKEKFLHLRTNFIAKKKYPQADL